MSTEPTIYAIKDRAPIFPRWMWFTAGNPRWTRIVGGMSPEWYQKNYSHWCPSKGAAPSIRPDAPESLMTPPPNHPLAVKAAREYIGEPAPAGDPEDRVWQQCDIAQLDAARSAKGTEAQ